MSSTRRFLATISAAAAAAALAVVILAVPHKALATSENVTAPGASGAAVNGSADARLKDFLQKRFLIDDPSRIELGPLQKTPLSGVLERVVSVRNAKGQSLKAELFMDSAQHHVILGQMYDLRKDPWLRTDLRGIHLEDRPVMGPDSAPVTIVEFADFECPYCARAFGTLETMVHTTYKGKVRLIFKDYPLNGHQWAVRAAVAAECARLQNPDAFWQFARGFYVDQGSINPQNIDGYIKTAASRAGLDSSALNACMAGKSALGHVTEDASDGVAVRVSSTPTLFINGVRVVGLPDEKTLDFVIRQQIEEASKTAGR